MNILSLGDLLMDVVVPYDPRSGEADAGPDVAQILPGGSAANFAVQAARLGHIVRFVSRVGRDWPGEMLVRSLEDDGVLASVGVSGTEATGRVLIMVAPDGNRRMWSYPGASTTIEPDDLDSTWFSGLDAFHLTGYSFLRPGPTGAAFEALRLAREMGARLCTLDPNPSHLIEDYGADRFHDLLRQLQFDIIFPNLEEGRLLANKHQPEDVASDLLELSPIVALTLGDEGCLVAAAGQMFRIEAGGVGGVVDVTGAGDAFAAAFVVEYLNTGDLHAAAVAGNALAAQVVSTAGGR